MNFKTYSLKELATIKYGKNQKQVQDKEGTIPIYGTGGVMGYATKSLYDSPSVLIGRKGTIGKVKFVSSPFWTIDTLFYTEVNTDIIYPKYLYYVMSLLDLNQYNEGTTIPSLRTETLNRLEFNIPSIQTQRKILDILNPLDDKIELNHQINKNLEQQAQAIFKSSFNSIKNGYLSDVCQYAKEKISISELTLNNYYSTENILPNKVGVDVATNLPKIIKATKCNIGDILVSNIRPYFKK